jgi:transposase-like protein
MVTSKGVLECPYCGEIFEVETSDRIHTAFSTAKPIPKMYYGEVKVKKYKCQNPTCGKTFTVYWYSPLEYFSRI